MAFISHGLNSDAGFLLDVAARRQTGCYQYKVGMSADFNASQVFLRY